MSTTTNTRTTFVRFLRTRTRRVRVSPQLWQQIPFLHWPLNLEESAHTHTHGSKPSRENSWILPLMVMEPHSCIFARTLHTDLGPSKSYSRDLRLQPPPYEDIVGSQSISRQHKTGGHQLELPATWSTKMSLSTNTSQSSEAVRLIPALNPAVLGF